jgi:aspartyl-tRNA(Asn)/glutamyl-tRNA(Gln) amidotransferase subunit C
VAEKKMSNDKIDVRYVANLARIELSDEEVRTFQAQLEQIVGYVEQIGALDVDGIEPTSHAHPVMNVFRKDELKVGLEREDVMANAPEQVDNQFKVPKILE